MATKNLLYKREYAIREDLRIVIPTVGEILECEDEYYGAVSLLTAMPADMMVQLDDIGVDFSRINAYDLFLLLFHSLQERDTSMIFGSLDLRRFCAVGNERSGGIVLMNPETGAVIDRAVHAQIAGALRLIHHLEKNTRKPANKEAKEYMLRRARDKMKRRKNRSERSQLEDLIVAMVNTEQYPYGFEGTRELSIYQFNESVRQVIQKINYEHTMHGVYSGTVSAKDLSRDDLNWLSHK